MHLYCAFCAIQWHSEIATTNNRPRNSIIRLIRSDISGTAHYAILYLSEQIIVTYHYSLFCTALRWISPQKPIPCTASLQHSWIYFCFLQCLILFSRGYFWANRRQPFYVRFFNTSYPSSLLLVRVKFCSTCKQACLFNIFQAHSNTIRVERPANRQTVSSFNPCTY